MFKRPVLVVLIALLCVLGAIQYFNVPGRPTVFTMDTFEKAQSDAEQSTPPRLLVVDFAASWCGPCRQMDRGTWTSPTLTDWLKQNAVTVKVDVDEDKARARAFGISQLPTVVVLRGKKEVARLIGLQSATQLMDQLKPLAAQ